MLLDDIFRRGDELNEDPLHGFLVGLRLFAELMANLPANYPGCLAASFAYQDQLFNREIRDLNAGGMLAWRQRFRERLELIAQKYPPKQEVDFEALADMAATLVEGGLVLGPPVEGPDHSAAADFALPRSGPVRFLAGLVTGDRPPRHCRT